MKIRIADSFIDSLKTIRIHQTWWYRAYATVRYDIPRFINNVWLYRKPLWNTYWFDHHGPLMHLQISLDHMAGLFETRGLEVDSSRLKKVEKMRRASQLLKNYNEDLYIEMAEAELGELILRDWEFEPIPENPNYYKTVSSETPEEEAHNRKVFNRAREIQEAEWIELWKIIQGQDYSNFKTADESSWDDQFDGSGIQGWWD